MKKSLYQKIFLTFIITSLSYLAFQKVALSQECNVSIISPTEGQEVGRDGLITGTAQIPNNKNYYLWILTRASSLKGREYWWPQGDSEHPIRSGEWERDISYGKRWNIGEKFDVMVVIVNQQIHQKFKRLFEKSDPENLFNPPWYRSPYSSSVDDCSVAEVVVTKIFH